MNKKILISIITVVRNDEKNIEKTIKNIINLKNESKNESIEYVIVDGNSTDNTKKIINNYRNFIDKFISEPDINLYDAINKGIRLSSGQVIGCCSSGDIYKPGALKIVANYFIKNPDVDFFFGTIIRNYVGATRIKHGFYPDKIWINWKKNSTFIFKN